MQSNQTIGIESAAEGTGLAGCSGQNVAFYNDQSWLAKRHGLGLEVDPTVNVMDAGLSAIVRVRTATAPPYSARCRVPARYDGLL